jgi:Sulfotransferase family
VKRRPDLFIVGAPKCGTTSLYQYLKGHPEVFMSVAKEPRYFSPDDALGASGHALRHGRDLERYLDLFADAREEKRLGEASVGYIYSRLAPGLIHEFQPDARIVVMLRNPVDMIYSLHGQRLSEDREDEPDFAAALAAEDDRRAGRGVPAHATPAGSTYRDRGRFAQLLPPWFETFGRDRVWVIIFEDFIRDPAGEFRRLLEFLDVDPAYQPPEFGVHNPSHAARSRTLRTLTKTRPAQWIVWQVMPRVIGDRATRALVRRFRHSRINRMPLRREPLDAGLRAQLEAEYAPDVAALSELLGRDMSALWFSGPTRKASAMEAGSAVAG